MDPQASHETHGMTGKMPIPQDKMMQHIESHPLRIVFSAISGAHLYGFP
jgi:hypothetical protein